MGLGPILLVGNTNGLRPLVLVFSPGPGGPIAKFNFKINF